MQKTITPVECRSSRSSAEADTDRRSGTSDDGNGTPLPLCPAGRWLGVFRVHRRAAPLESSEAPAPAGVGIGQRDLTAEEKKVIMDAVAYSLRNPGSAKYQWAKFPAVVTDGSVNYCATVDAQSPMPRITVDKPTWSAHRRAATAYRQPSSG